MSVMKSYLNMAEIAEKQMIQRAIMCSDGSGRTRSFPNLSAEPFSLVTSDNTPWLRIIFVKALKWTPAWSTPVVQHCCPSSWPKSWVIDSTACSLRAATTLPTTFSTSIHLAYASVQLLTMMVDLSIPMQQKYVYKLTKARQRGPETVYQGSALRHLPGGSALPPGRTSIFNTPVTAEETEAVDQAHAKAKPKFQAFHET